MNLRNVRNTVHIHMMQRPISRINTHNKFIKTYRISGYRSCDCENVTLCAPKEENSIRELYIITFLKITRVQITY
jgi:hypothetical protein